MPPASSITNIFVSGGSWIVVGGGPLQMTARIQTSSSSPNEFVEDTEHVAWSTEPAGVLSVDRQGRATAVAPGSARVVATVGDRSGRSPVITAVPEFSGTWSGNYIITGCTGAVDFRTCGRLMFSQQDGSRIPYPFSLTLSQLQDQVQGTLRETSPTFNHETPVHGFVRLSGALVLEASVPQPGLEPFVITNSSITINTARTQMSGGYTRIQPSKFDLTGSNFTLRTEHEFSGVTRTP